MTVLRLRRRWFRLNLRGLLVAILLIGIGLGGWIESAGTQANAVAALRAIDPHTVIEYAVNSRPGCEVVGTIPPDPLDEAKRPWWVPRWVFRQLGRDYFLNATWADINLPDDPPARAAAIGHLARLRHLIFLSINPPISDADIEPLAHLTNLREFTGFGTCSGVTDRAMASIARWHRLEQLALRTPSITDVGLATLGRLPALRSIDLTDFLGDPPDPNWGIAWSGRAEVEPGAFPALTDLSLRDRLDPGADLRLLGRLEALNHLDLGGRSIRDYDLRHLGSLRNLAKLDLDDVSLDGTGFRHLSHLTELEQVNIESLNVTDATLADLTRLPSLTSIYLTGTQVTARGLEALQSAQNLTDLNIEPRISGDRHRLQQVLPHCDLNGCF